MSTDTGASSATTGLAGAEAPEPPSRLGPSDGIPSAVTERMEEVIAAAKRLGHTLHSWWMSPPIYDLFESESGARPLTYQGLPIQVHDEWSWGWMLVTRRPHKYALPRPFDPASAIEAATAGETGTGSTEGDSPAPKGDAQ